LLPFYLVLCEAWHTPAEVDVADAMGKEAALVNASFALALGDNFYENGVKNEHDSRFKHTFEDVFTSEHLKADNFWKICAGNHDHYGNVTGQIEYSKISSRWHFPELYYTWTEDVTDSENNAIAKAQFVLIDTVTLAGDSTDPETGEHLTGDNYTGPADLDAAAAQMDWINSTLASSTAEYIVMGGHFPVWSVCEHGE
jgi:tartrate-resistant acid phosphatase type 5